MFPTWHITTLRQSTAHSKLVVHEHLVLQNGLDVDAHGIELSSHLGGARLNLGGGDSVASVSPEPGRKQQQTAAVTQ